MGRVTASDAELVEASRRGERAAFGELVERYQRVVCAVGYSGTSDRSLGEDVAQDTFIAAYHQLDQLRDVSRVREWLCGIARNLARKARRVRDREEVIDEAQPDVAGTPFDHASEHERDTVVASALERVPETYREALVLYYTEQRSVLAVASALGISPDAVHQRLSRGRQLVAAEVAEVVEHTLEHRRTRRNLAVAVLAALPVVTPAHANASPGGTSMLKTGIAVTTVLLAAGTGYAVHRSTQHHEPTPERSAVVTGSPMNHVSGRHGASTPSVAARGPSSASVPPALPGGSAETHDCAAVERHLKAVAQQAMGLVEAPAHLTREQVNKMTAALRQAGGSGVVVIEAGSDAPDPTSGVVVVPNDSDGPDPAALAGMTGVTEHQCLAEHWPQEFIDCLATVNDLWSAASCGNAPSSDGPTTAARAAVTDASCSAVGTHYASLVAPPLAAVDDVPSIVIAQMNAGLSELPAQIEASCASSDWSESIRRCIVASATTDELGTCR